MLSRSILYSHRVLQPGPRYVEFDGTQLSIFVSPPNAQKQVSFSRYPSNCRRLSALPGSSALCRGINCPEERGQPSPWRRSPNWRGSDRSSPVALDIDEPSPCHRTHSLLSGTTGASLQAVQRL